MIYGFSQESLWAQHIACRDLTSSILFPQQGEMWLCHLRLSPVSVKGAPHWDAFVPRRWQVLLSCHTTRRLLIWFELAVFMLFNGIFIAMCHSLQCVTSTDWVHTYTGSWQGVHHGCLNRENLILHGFSKLMLQWNSMKDLNVGINIYLKCLRWLALAWEVPQHMYTI